MLVSLKGLFVVLALTSVFALVMAGVVVDHFLVYSWR